MLLRSSVLVLLTSLCAAAQAPQNRGATIAKAQLADAKQHTADAASQNVDAKPQNAAARFQTEDTKPKDVTAKPPNSEVPNQRQLEKKLEAYLRNLFAWGPAFGVKLGPFTDAIMPGFYQVQIQVTYNGQPDTGIVYFSKDGKYFMRGELNDVAVDPFAENRSKLHIDGNPSKGPADAPVTVVEFSDFECPHCRELSRTLKDIEPKYPQVRFVFKDFPLVQIHPWAMTAALAARCAYTHSADAFWKIQEAIFDNQDIISADNAWDKLQAFALQAGISGDAFRSCAAAPETRQAVDANIADARALKVTSTPTVYVNGRPLVGGGKDLLEQFISYELATLQGPSLGHRHPERLAMPPFTYIHNTSYR